MLSNHIGALFFNLPNLVPTSTIMESQVILKHEKLNMAPREAEKEKGKTNIHIMELSHAHLPTYFPPQNGVSRSPSNETNSIGFRMV